MSEYTPAVPALAFRDIHFDVIDRNGQPWLQAAQIAQALGYAREDAVSKLYSRNSDEFTDAMTLTVKLTVKGARSAENVNSTVSGNLQREVRVFSLRGAHLLAMFARTAVAKAFRRWVLDVLDDLAKPALPKPAIPAPAAHTATDFIDFRYDRRPLRITRLAGALWYGSNGVARALCLRDSGDITRYMSGTGQMRVVPHKGRQLMVIDHPTLLEAAGRARPEYAARFLHWLGQILRRHFADQAPALPDAVDPLQRVTGDGRQLALDYLDECRQIIGRSGDRLPVMDAEAAQRVADGLAAQLVANRRWVLSFDGDGLPVLKGLRADTVLLRLDDREHLAQLLREQVPADALPEVLDAGLRRLGTLTLPSR